MLKESREYRHISIFLQESRKDQNATFWSASKNNNKLLTLLDIFAVIFVAIKAYSENATPGR